MTLSDRIDEVIHNGGMEPSVPVPKWLLDIWHKLACDQEVHLRELYEALGTAEKQLRKTTEERDENEDHCRCKSLEISRLQAELERFQKEAALNEESMMLYYRAWGDKCDEIDRLNDEIDLLKSGKTKSTKDTDQWSVTHDGMTEKTAYHIAEHLNRDKNFTREDYRAVLLNTNK